MRPRTRVKYLVTLSFFFLPLLPSLFHLARTGITSIESNSMMMEAVIYGETPNENNENLSKVPPPSRFIMPNIPLLVADALMASALIYGIVIAAPKRNTNSNPNVKTTLRRNSPFLKTLFKKLSILDHLSFSTSCFNCFYGTLRELVSFNS